MKARRGVATKRVVTAGCVQCSGQNPIWKGGAAQGVAARHSYARGHHTWVEVSMRIEYGIVRDFSGPSMFSEKMMQNLIKKQVERGAGK